MPIDVLDGTLTVKTRDQDRDDWQADFQFRMPDAEIGEGTQVFIDASVAADANQPIYANALVLADATSFLTARGDLLTKHAAELGRPRRDATGSSGFVICEAASGGGEILEGEELRYEAKGTRLECAITNVYADGDLVPVRAIDSGTGGNVPAGTRLKWVSPPAGILGTCLVFENADGSGITGGGPQESDEDLIEALKTLHAEPASSGNDADVIQFIEKLTGIAIQKAFVYPAVPGPGEYSIAFTMRPDTPGASRIPNGTHIATVLAEVIAAFPGDDGATVASVLNHDVAPCVKVKWRTDQRGFVDAAPWPRYDAAKVTVQASPVPTVSSCRVNNVNASTGVLAVGKSIGFYDSVTKTFKVKRILTATLVSGTTYDLTFNMAADASDPAFVPASGAIVSPWSPSSSELVTPILEYVDRQGPGEMYAALPGDVYPAPGRRQRRVPEDRADQWPSNISNSILDDVFELCGDATLVEPTTPYATTIGTPAMAVYLHRVTDLGIFAL